MTINSFDIIKFIVINILAFALLYYIQAKNINKLKLQLKKYEEENKLINANNESEKKFEALFNKAENAIALIEINDDNTTGKYIEINDSACKRLEYTREELLNMTPYHIRYEKECVEYENALKNLLKSGRIMFETNQISKNGKVIPVEISWHMFTLNKKRVLLSIARDITERKENNEKLLSIIEQNKKLLEKTIENDKIKTEFFSNISHEFKTPLNVILGTVQLMSSYKNDDKIDIQAKKFNKYIDVMKQNCYRLLRLINNLIDITKIDSDDLEINCKNYNIINVVEEITLSVVEFASNKGIEVIFDTEVEEKIIVCDVDKITRIILNIFSNSIKNTNRGGNIYVNIYDEKENIIIRIRDTGVGIPKDKLKLVFEKFGQVDSSLNRLNEGSGIGLALVKSLVEKHEGEIWIESELNVGTEVFIKLPVKVMKCEDKKYMEYKQRENLKEKVNIEFSDIYFD